jgi:hypothetical protein
MGKRHWASSGRKGSFSENYDEYFQASRSTCTRTIGALVPYPLGPRHRSRARPMSYQIGLTTFRVGFRVRG